MNLDSPEIFVIFVWVMCIIAMGGLVTWTILNINHSEKEKELCQMQNTECDILACKANASLSYTQSQYFLLQEQNCRIKEALEKGIPVYVLNTVKP